MPPIEGCFSVIGSVVGVDIANHADLFTDGYCDRCAAPRGQRSEAPLEYKYATGRDMRTHGLAATYGPNNYSASPHLFRLRVLLASERFVDGIADEEREQLVWRPATAVGRSVQPMFELCGSRTHVEPVRLHGDALDLIQCPDCGWMEPPHYLLRADLPARYADRRYGRGKIASTFVEAGTLPAPLPPCFTTGTWYGIDHGRVFPEQRWLKMHHARKRFTTGMTDSLLEVVARDETV